MDKIIYLDNAATTFPKPDIVHDTVRDLLRGDAYRRGFFGPAVDVEGGERRLASGAGPEPPPAVSEPR